MIAKRIPWTLIIDFIGTFSRSSRGVVSWYIPLRYWLVLYHTYQRCVTKEYIMSTYARLSIVTILLMGSIFPECVRSFVLVPTSHRIIEGSKSTCKRGCYGSRERCYVHQPSRRALPVAHKDQQITMHAINEESTRTTRALAKVTIEIYQHQSPLLLVYIWTELDMEPGRWRTMTPWQVPSFQDSTFHHFSIYAGIHYTLYLCDSSVDYCCI